MRGRRMPALRSLAFQGRGRCPQTVPVPRRRPTRARPGSTCARVMAREENDTIEIPISSSVQARQRAIAPPMHAKSNAARATSTAAARALSNYLVPASAATSVMTMPSSFAGVTVATNVAAVVADVTTP